MKPTERGPNSFTADGWRTMSPATQQAIGEMVRLVLSKDKTNPNPMNTPTNASAPALAAQTTKPWTDAKLLSCAVRRLNQQHRDTSAGFYGLGSRFFRARARNGVLEVFDWDNWTPVAQEAAQFHTHNGNDISFQ